MRTPAQVSGDTAERLVAERLAREGWTILGRNVRVGRRELDLVAVDPHPPAAVVVVEVRWRRNRSFGLPEETVDWRKRCRLREAALGLIDLGRLPDGREVPHLPLRIDIVVVEPGLAPDGAHRVRHHRFAVG
ncbi:MAG TPA: YraN family protein [Candidatus Limnocylindrales bacterium]